MDHNMPVQIFLGEDFLDEVPKQTLFGPPITFKTFLNDSSRMPLKLNLKSLNHKTGIILNEFYTACGLNVLRWSAASENNYFTTNRFWLLITQNVSDIESLEDPEIFLPPDSEVKVLIRSRNDNCYSLWDIYKKAAFKPLKTQLIGQSFTAKKDMLKALKTYGSVISRRENLEGIVFNTGLVINFPDKYTDIEDLALRHIDTMAKVNNRLVMELANKLNMR